MEPKRRGKSQESTRPIAKQKPPRTPRRQAQQRYYELRRRTELNNSLENLKALVLAKIPAAQPRMTSKTSIIETARRILELFPAELVPQAQASLELSGDDSVEEASDTASHHEEPHIHPTVPPERVSRETRQTPIPVLETSVSLPQGYQHQNPSYHGFDVLAQIPPPFERMQMGYQTVPGPDGYVTDLSMLDGTAWDPYL